MSTELVTNPFGQVAPAENALAAAEPHRHEAEIQAAMVIAKRFPRDPVRAVDRILQACTRPTLAEHALYAYPKGNELVTGPSIRLAEALAQSWGNLQFGIRELSQARGESTVEAFAWDLETNTRQSKVFQVPHLRHTKRGQYRLEDPREVYELVANQGARRLRACILGVLPGDVVEAAVKQCELTQANAEGAPEEQVKRLVEAFGDLGVTQEQIVRFLGHRLDSVVAAEVIRLRKVFTAIRDGLGSVGDFFPVELSPAPEAGARLKDKLRAKVDGESLPKAEPPAPPAKPQGPTHAAPAPKDGAAPKPLSKAQHRRLAALFKEAGIPRERVKAWLARRDPRAYPSPEDVHLDGLTGPEAQAVEERIPEFVAQLAHEAKLARQEAEAKERLLQEALDQACDEFGWAGDLGELEGIVETLEERASAAAQRAEYRDGAIDPEEVAGARRLRNRAQALRGHLTERRAAA